MYIHINIFPYICWRKSSSNNYIYIYIYIIVTKTLRLTKVHHARRINEDSQSKPHSKHERRELKNARMDNF